MSAASDLAKVARQWLQKAGNDLTTATHTLTLGGDCPFDTVCFHAQQCVEKCVKAVLVLHGVDFPRIHDLGVLVARLPGGVDLPINAEEQEVLTDFATVTRYPGEWDPIGEEEAHAAVAVADRVWIAVRGMIERQLPSEA